MSRYHARITGNDFAALADLVTKYKIAVARHTIEKVSDGYCVDAHVTDEQITTLAAAGYKLQQLEDADAQGKVRQSEVRARKAAPLTTNALSVAAATAYLDVEQVEAALAAESAAPNDSFTQLIKLPHSTWEKRTCHALKIAKGSGAKRPRHLFSGRCARTRMGKPRYPDSFRTTAFECVSNKYADHDRHPHIRRDGYQERYRNERRFCVSTSES